jgi:enamine deaminase RidA (YjgF/YER057c/UK114 family)
LPEIRLFHNLWSGRAYPLVPEPTYPFCTRPAPTSGDGGCDVSVYSLRAVRVGPFVSVGGTAPLGPDGTTVGKGDPAAQARRCFEIIREALEGAGASLDDVVRTRLILTRIEDYEAVAAVRKEFVGHVKPVDTIMQIDRFVDPDWLLEIEADAVIADATAWAE